METWAVTLPPPKQEQEQERIIIYSSGLSKVINYISKWHKIHGVQLLTHGKPATVAAISWAVFLHSMRFGCCVFLFIGGFVRFSTNDQLQRIACIICWNIHVVVTLQAFLLWNNRKKIWEFVDWCHWLETRPQTFCKTPKGWFEETQKEVVKLNS